MIGTGFLGGNGNALELDYRDEFLVNIPRSVIYIE